MKSVVISLMACICLSGCVKQIPRPEPRHQIGDIVYSKVSGQPGQIIWHSWPHALQSHDPGRYYYGVRFAVHQYRTHTYVLSSDDPITVEAFSVVRMRDFEFTKQGRDD